MKKDSQVTVEELKQKVRDFCEAREWDKFHSGKDLAIGLVTEASELLEIFRFQEGLTPELIKARGQWSDVEDELADVLFFLLRFSQMWGVDLAQAFDRKMKKNAERYSVEEYRGRNDKARS